MPATLRGALVRTLDASDIASLAALSARIGVESAADWTERLARAGQIVVGAERDGRLVGYAAGSVRRGFGRARSAGWIEIFAVELGERGHGVGRALAVELLERLRERGAEEVLTLVPLHDRALDPFFRDLGFRDQPVVCLGRVL